MEFSDTNIINILDATIDEDKKSLLDFDEKVEVFLVQQGTKSALDDCDMKTALDAVKTNSDKNLYDANGNLKIVVYKENPAATAYGQDVVSVSESFLARKLRAGRPRRVGVYSQSVNGTAVVSTVRAATADTVFYPNRLMITSNVACSGYFEITTGISSADTIRRTYTLASAGSQAFDLPDGYYVLPAGTIKATTTATSGTIDYEVQGAEVAYSG